MKSGADKARGMQIRLLGELALLRNGRALPLPPSKKTRALLAYLAVSGKPQLREHLCTLLWDGPDDPRAQLRWSLSKLRLLLDDSKVRRLRADRERIALEVGTWTSTWKGFGRRRARGLPTSRPRHWPTWPRVSGAPFWTAWTCRAAIASMPGASPSASRCTPNMSPW